MNASLEDRLDGIREPLVDPERVAERATLVSDRMKESIGALTEVGQDDTEAFESHMAIIHEEKEKRLQTVRAKQEKLLGDAREEKEKRLTSVCEANEKYIEAAREEKTEELRMALSTCNEKIDQSIEAARQVSQETDPCEALPWDDPFWQAYAPLSDVSHGPRLSRLGTLRFNLSMDEAGQLAESDQQRTIEVPAMVPIIGEGNLFLVGQDTGMNHLRDVLQSTALRLLAAVPPGRMRLTLVDPVGLGQNFSELLNLDEFVSGPRAWHEKKQIKAALEDLTTHMSTVIQKYLTNEHETIEAYNEVAGEVAEPYRLLLVSDFPAGFDGEAAQRLLSIAKNGPRLGVYVLLTWNQSRSLPRQFAKSKSEDVLLDTGTTVKQTGNGNQLSIQIPDLSDGIVMPDSLPEKEVIDDIVEAINGGAEEAQRVEVGFGGLTPGTLWQESSAERLSAPIGQRGTDMHALTLGEGTTHHALLGGQTGSGKSVLLHTLICSLCMRHSPEELQLYLVDFKEGVEFSLYKTLPHARVVAIESEREFGLSVLRGLRDELDRRGDRFREAGTSNLADYREQTGETCPRIFFIADEFQVFFERSDKLSQEVRSLLDFLVREGRSFGVHVLLSSQSLPSENALQRSTLGQLGVRIALQMSETESYRILSKSNDAARYMERPGEAIYNDHGGEAGYNTKFQVAFMPEDTREDRLEQIVSHAEEQGAGSTPLVFEGHKPASIETNDDLLRLHREGPPAERPRSAPLYLGEPVRIQDQHTAFKLRRQARSNLLICGQDQGTAMSAFLSSCWSFLAHHQPGAAELRVLDLSNVDSEVHGHLDVLGRARPEDVEQGGRRQTVPFLEDLSDELERRIEAADAGKSAGPPILLAIFGLQSARELQSQDYKASPEAEIFQQLLYDGPDLGIHVLAWVNTYSRLTSVIKKKYVNEFEGRVALRGGSSEKILSRRPSDVDIKRHYGLYQNQVKSSGVQKFRSYGQSALNWMQSTLEATAM
jgi:hypothetical protein